MFHTQPANGPVPLGAQGQQNRKNRWPNINRAPSKQPASPIGSRGPRRVKVDLETIKVIGNLADGATYGYWTFNQKVPGPFIRVQVGDTVEVHLKNHDDSVMMHNVDFHAVTGPAAAPRRPTRVQASRMVSNSRRLIPACLCITALYRSLRGILPMACTA